MFLTTPFRASDIPCRGRRSGQYIVPEGVALKTMSLITAQGMLCLVAEMMCHAAPASDSCIVQINDVPANEVLRAPPNVAQPVYRVANVVQGAVWTASVVHLTAKDVVVANHLHQTPTATTADDPTTINDAVCATTSGSCRKTGTPYVQAMICDDGSEDVLIHSTAAANEYCRIARILASPAVNNTCRPVDPTHIKGTAPEAMFSLHAESTKVPRVSTTTTSGVPAAAAMQIVNEAHINYTEEVHCLATQCR